MREKDKKLKIIFIYDCIYPDSLGGVEFRNYQLAKFLLEKGHNITLAGWVKENKHPLNVTIISLPFSKKLYNSLGQRTALISLKYAFAILTLPLQKFDLIFVDNIPYIHLFLLTLWTKILNKKVIITWHEYWGKYWQTYIKNWTWMIYYNIEILAAQLGDKVICVSEFTAEKLRKARIKSDEIEIVSNGINLDFTSSLNSQNINDKPPLIYAGRLIKEKRVDLLLKAVAIFAKKNNYQGVILQIIGEGNQREELENLAQKLDILDQVIFKGKLETIEEVWQEISQAKIAIQPSLREGFGIFPLEAIALGIPVIYCHSQESAVKEIVRDGIEGIAVNPDENDLSQAIAQLLYNELEYQKLSNNGKIRAKSFDWQEITDKLEKICFNYLEE
ncbi:MAG: glycosyltransferase family 4 protein [Cyanobacteria bacterium]|nr:glycosyltransferase family 4 protein [Cyanobacteria bacterium CG_2015-16_32_12]NCO77067.1 glycosyltransferase family 4 protein [Cyanobacteria bacterium CG_2015-22_32_23]NCQ03639.1 glycosyltransferase family 4 protein [Cyanobacteria bacterium CG_2015-09_32_10]NCQ40366.1 glycosyltransferase family 4 protein [Cyanobacteria bacterium CG_2015-04_32_10]NCS84634.1 glycosyltransferase family 4 protein [Cyanobacteria bacterium CG_2015-02_32_10]